MRGHEDWKVFSQIRTKDHDELPAVLTRAQVIALLKHISLRRYRIPVKLIRYSGFCHPAAKVKRERIAFQIGRPLFIGDFGKSVQSATAPLARSCPGCGGAMKTVATIEPPWRAKHRTNRGPPCQPKIQKPKCP